MATMATKSTIIPAREAKNHFGELLDTVQRGPVIITKKGRPVAKIVAFVDRKHFEEMEDQMWGERALAAEKEGYLTPAESEAFLKKMRAHAHSRNR